MKLPLHPALVHFPVACWTLGTLADAIGAFRSSVLPWQLAFGLLCVGTAMGLLAAAAGFYELARLPEDHPAQDDAQRHMRLALSAWVAYASALFLRMDGTTPTPPGAIALIASIIGFLLLAATGHMGARLVYVHGVGRRMEGQG